MERRCSIWWGRGITNSQDNQKANELQKYVSHIMQGDEFRVAQTSLNVKFLAYQSLYPQFNVFVKKIIMNIFTYQPIKTSE